jgi:hypothetical protein
VLLPRLPQFHDGNNLQSGGQTRGPGETDQDRDLPQNWQNRELDDMCLPQ